MISCGKISPKGSIQTTAKNISDFEMIDFNGKFRVFYVKDKTSKIEIETYPNLMDNLDISVKNNLLKINEKREVKGVDFYNITVYSKKEPRSIMISDSIEFNGSSELQADNLQFNLKNSAKFIGAIRTKNTTVEMSEHSLANIKGYTQNAFLKLSDSASIIAPFWEIKSLDLQAKNGSYAEAKVVDELKGNLLDTASLLYYDQPIKKIKTEKNTKLVNKFAP